MKLSLKAVALLMAGTVGALSATEKQELHRRTLPKLKTLDYRFSPQLQPRHCPSQIGVAKAGWRDEARKRRWAKLSYRQRRNRRMAR